VAATGFHLQKYYPPDYWLFTTSAQEAKRFFIRELTENLEETCDKDLEPVRAGFIKIACEETIENSPMALLEVAAQAALETGAGIEVHTERGADAERIVGLLLKFGVFHNKIVLCHMDKRPDHDLHSTLAKEGVMLEYDTFFRPKYLPEEYVWPLLERMLDAGLSRQIALATDMANAEMWSSMGKGPGLKSLITTIARRLEGLGVQKEMIQGLIGQNISDCLARPC
jgi:phosphotriesterase-related protein